MTASLAAALGHANPFSTAECAALQTLVVRHALDLEFLQHCPELRELTILSSETKRLWPLTFLKKLRALTIRFTHVSYLRPLAECPSIEELELAFTSAEDIQPLASMTALRRARLVGNPWSPTSWSQRDHLWKASRARGSAPPLLEFSSQRDWEITRLLRSNGMRLSFHTVNGLRSLLARPGFGVLPNAEADSQEVHFITAIQAARTMGQKAEDLLRKLAGRVMKPNYQPVDPVNRIELGSSADAEKWVEASSLADADRAMLLRFVRRFPQLSFYRDTNEQLDEIEKMPDQVKLPGWLRSLRTTLAGVLPQCAMAVRFDQFDRDCLAAKKIAESWHVLEVRGYDDKQQREMLHDKASVYPVGRGEHSTFAISIEDENDRTVYDLNELFLDDLVYDGHSLRSGLAPAFDSYTSMLGHMIALKIDGSIEVDGEG
jgi:hypothetical protein